MYESLKYWYPPADKTLKAKLQDLHLEQKSILKKKCLQYFWMEVKLLLFLSPILQSPG